jgi:hypothetical protein
VALLDKVFPKQSEEAINATALKRVEELKNAQFQLSRSMVMVAILAPFAFLTLGTIYGELRQWIFFALATSASIAAALIFRKDRAIVETPRAIVAKVTRVVKRPRRGKGGGGYAIHYAFLAPNGQGYTGTWYGQSWDGRNYAPGMLVPVLYDGLNPDRNSAWGALSFYKWSSSG